MNSFKNRSVFLGNVVVFLDQNDWKSYKLYKLITVWRTHDMLSALKRIKAVSPEGFLQISSGYPKI